MVLVIMNHILDSNLYLSVEVVYVYKDYFNLESVIVSMVIKMKSNSKLYHHNDVF